MGDEDYKTRLLNGDDAGGDARGTASNKGRKGMFLRHLLYFTLVVACSSVVAFFLARPGCRKRFPTELGSVEQWINYEDVVFKPSGFHAPNVTETIYEGPPTPATDRHWESLFDVGIYRLTKEENLRLPVQSVSDPNNSDAYIVAIAMFHQIHCLNRLRRQIYEGGITADLYQEGDIVSRQHTEHCIDYLRQALMCHGDTTPIPFHYDWARKDPFDADWKVHHTCRNFDSIYQWAALRNDTGYVI